MVTNLVVMTFREWEIPILMAQIQQCFSLWYSPREIRQGHRQWRLIVPEWLASGPLYANVVWRLSMEYVQYPSMVETSDFYIQWAADKQSGDVT